MDNFDHGTTGPEGGPRKPFEKPMDQPDHQYETTNRDPSPANGLNETSPLTPQENPQDKSRKFV